MKGFTPAQSAQSGTTEAARDRGELGAWAAAFLLKRKSLLEIILCHSESLNVISEIQGGPFGRMVGLTLIRDAPPTYPIAQPVLPISKPRLKWAEGGTDKIKVNPIQLTDQMAHPVLIYPICLLHSNDIN